MALLSPDNYVVVDDGFVGLAMAVAGSVVSVEGFGFDHERCIAPL